MKRKLHKSLIFMCVFLCSAQLALAKVADTTVIISANMPGAPTLTADSPNQITANWSGDLNPSGAEYYIENTTNLTNSGWITSTSWPSSGLSCNTSYSFRVKSRNNNAIETPFSPISIGSTLNCVAAGSGGGNGNGSGAGLLLIFNEKPIGPFSLLINKGQVTTNSNVVVLDLNAGSNIKRMSISSDPHFINSVQEPYQSQKLWTLAEGSGEKTVYAKFFTAYGVSSDVISANINYDTTGIINDIAIIEEKIALLTKEIADLLTPVLPPVVLAPVLPLFLGAPEVLPPSTNYSQSPIISASYQKINLWSVFFGVINYALFYALFLLFILLLLILWQGRKNKP